MNTWIISDTHFQHSNMLNFTDDSGNYFRGDKFSDQHECDELMIQNWNSVIKPEDHVWHLGDVFFGDKTDFCKLWSRLMGKKRLIVGNHDDIRFLSGKNPVNDQWFFQKIGVWNLFKEHDFIATHVPMQLSNTFEGKRNATFNVHGHIHINKSPTLRHYNACVEVNDWAPINIDDLSRRLKKRKSSL